MFRFKQNMISRIMYGVFLVFGSLISLTGCSKEDVKEIITSLPPVNSENNVPVGNSANDFLSAATYSSVTIEVQYIAGFEPEGESVNNLIGFLYDLIKKPGGIHYSLKSIASPLKNNLTLTDIATIEKMNRTVFTSGNRLGVYILFTDGYYAQGNVVGLSYRNTSMCFFGKSIFENSGRVGQPTKVTLESSVMQHEFGHLLGLVDMGTPMKIYHKDAVHAGHCNNNSCLMFYALGSSEGVKELISGAIPELDENCKTDLTANGGK